MQKREEEKSSNKSVKAEEVKTEAQKIWNEIKEKSVDMFALPNQVVSQYCKPAFIEPGRLYLLVSAASFLPSLETALGEKFTVEIVDKYLVVSRAAKKQK